MNGWLFLDVSYLAWRAYYTTGELSHEGKPTGVLFGIFRELRDLRKKFDTRNVAFFFDHEVNLRKRKYPWYKVRTGKNCPTEAVRGSVRLQIDQLRTALLPRLGYGNLFQAEGYEADDLIAWAAGRLAKPRNCTVVSNDADLYQLFRRGVAIYRPSPGELMTEYDFRERFFGLDPDRWAEVKAIAGCPSDTIPGCEGVRELTAAKFLTGQLGGGVRYKDIREWVKTSQYDINLELCRLPYPGCPRVELKEDEEPKNTGGMT